jgi:hypothetical protein
MSVAFAARIADLFSCSAVWMAERAAFRDERGRMDSVWLASEADWAQVSGDEDVRDMIDLVLPLKVDWVCSAGGG